MTSNNCRKTVETRPKKQQPQITSPEIKWHLFQNAQFVHSVWGHLGSFYDRYDFKIVNTVLWHKWIHANTNHEWKTFSVKFRLFDRYVMSITIYAGFVLWRCEWWWLKHVSPWFNMTECPNMFSSFNLLQSVFSLTTAERSFKCKWPFWLDWEFPPSFEYAVKVTPPHCSNKPLQKQALRGVWLILICGNT